MPKRPRSSSPYNEQRRKWRKVIIYSDSDESNNSDSEQQNREIRDGDALPSQNQDPSSADNLIAESMPLQIDSLPEPLSELDAELLAALGDPAEDIPEYGENILQDLAQRWVPLLRKGISKDKKDNLLKEHTIPENCKFLRAPTLNAEISAAISDISRARDKKVEANQNQLGLGITAVGRGLSLLLTNDDKQKKVQAIKFISDGCRILADLHYTETQARVRLITPSLDKSFINIIQDLGRDESLFSCKLAEKIKASKAIEKQGLQIKKVPPIQKSSTTVSSQPQSTYRLRTQGNWVGPSRYQPSNRGGRRGATRNYGSADRKTLASTSTNKAIPASGIKQRAQKR